jgi:mono/diheme cytochrome c family protein
VRAAALIGLGIVISVTSAVIGVAVFVQSGFYDIGADDHHTRPVAAIIEALRERSISVRSGSLDVPGLADPATIAAGASRYSALCVGCHLAPGVAKSDLRPGLYPRAPNLAKEGILDPRRTFWTIKHGIKMSAMPAWGKTLDDAAIWEIVAFVRQIPTMSPEGYRQLSKSRTE